MFTLEQKIDMVMRYIATSDKTTKGELKKAIMEALNVGATTPDVEDMIAELLKKIGMSAHLVGYKYTIRAVKLCMDDPTYLRYVTHRLYPDIAKAHDTTPSAIERNIRRAIDSVFDRCDMRSIVEVLGNTIDINKGKMTNTSFIGCCANEVNRQLKKLGMKGE